MRTLHRILAVFVVAFGLYIGTTGVTTQLIDLQALLRHAPASDPTMRAIRNGIYGPPNYAVIAQDDFAAAALPSDFDYDGALATVTSAARSLAGGPISFVEVRMLNGKAVGVVGSQRQVYSFDAATGASLGPPTTTAPLPNSVRTAGLRNDLKGLHRLSFGGNWSNYFLILFGTSLLVMIFTGLFMYVRLLLARRRMGKPSPFWSAGGLWRTLHRGVAIVAALFLTIVASSGVVLATSSIGVQLNKAIHHGQRPWITRDYSSPLTDAQLPGMLHTTLASYGQTKPNASIRVLRLRTFSNMQQGVVITGEDEAQQLVFNAETGRRASMTEPGYPHMDMTFGWQVDETAKHIHRGDYFGLTGRMMDLLAGLSLLYLCISGAVMYFDMWTKRRQKGRRAFFWSDASPTSNAPPKVKPAVPASADARVSTTSGPGD